MFKTFKIHSYEKGFLFREDEFKGILQAGTHRFFDPFNKIRVDISSVRNPWIVHEKLDLLVKSGQLAGQAEVIDLKDHQRALVWIDNRFFQILGPGQYAYWIGQKDVRVEMVDARTVRLQHEEIKAIVHTPNGAHLLNIVKVQRDHVGVLYLDGRYVDLLHPGEYAFWKGTAEANVVEVDLRETLVDVGGQDIITADKVTLRLNAVVTYKVADAHRSISRTSDVRQALYRDTQLVLRGVIGARELDTFLTEKDGVAREIEEGVRRRASELGLEIASVGIRDIILPGEMKDLLNKVMEARKAAEANLIVRREETAAMRSQANTARLLADNPMLMRLRELEVLEKIASNNKLNIVVGDKGLADKVINLM